MTPFDWNEFLNLADRLVRDAPDEAAHRTAISRAYYAAYHAAARFVRAKGILTIGHSHLTVWNALAGEPDPDRAWVGVRGFDLKRVRQDADYATTFPGNLSTKAQAAITRSRALIAALDRLT